MYKAYQRRPPHHERVLEPWLEDYKKTGTQLVSARPCQYPLASDFSLNNYKN